jgi:restriction system protein
MGRRSRSSFADDVIKLVSLMPWWLGVGLAVVLFLALHHVAAMPAAAPLVEPGKPPPIAAVIVPAMMRALATGAQFVLPVLFLIGAGISAVKRRQSRQLVLRATEVRSVSAVDDMSWRQFERLVAEAFRMRGYSASEVGGDGPDGGVDIVLTQGTEKFLVQCKHWRAQRVGVDVVRELYGVMAAKGAAGGFVVTSGRFTSEAHAFARGRNVTLIDGVGLAAFLREATKLHSSTAQEGPRAATMPTTPRCPKCDGAMVKRVARQGSSAGNEFWGCSDFPNCRGTRPA